MARMHSRKRGKSGSTKPVKKTQPSWVRYSVKEIEMLILKLAKEEKTASEIGLILRDVYGIPDTRTICKKSITQILKERKLLPAIPEDITALLKKNIEIIKHLGKNKKDQPAKRGLTLTESKIKRLVKYYKRTGRLTSDWKYDPKKASFAVR